MRTDILKGMIGYRPQPGTQNDFMANQSWYNPNAPEYLENLKRMSIIQQILDQTLKKWEIAKKARVRGPQYSILALAAEMAAKHPIAGNDTTRTDGRAELAKKINRERYENLGLFAPSNKENNSGWTQIFQEIERRRQNQPPDGIIRTGIK